MLNLFCNQPKRFFQDGVIALLNQKTYTENESY
jgi:hypothetical protein